MQALVYTFIALAALGVGATAYFALIFTPADAIVVAVAHNEFLNFDYQKYKRNNAVIFDTKACLDRSLVDARL